MLCIVDKLSGYVQQGTAVGTGAQLLTVEQDCLSLGTDVKTPKHVLITQRK